MTTYKILRKQNISGYCLVCGTENPLSLHARFYELEDGRLAGVTAPLEEHQSYPERVHGGIITALLDETIGRAINITEPETWAVTTHLEIAFKKPVPYHQRLVCLARITSSNRKLFTGEGELILPDGEIAATAKAKYFKQKLDAITEAGDDRFGWRPLAEEEDSLQNLEIPDRPQPFGRGYVSADD